MDNRNSSEETTGGLVCAQMTGYPPAPIGSNIVLACGYRAVVTARDLNDINDQ